MLLLLVIYGAWSVVCALGCIRGRHTLRAVVVGDMLLVLLL